MLVQFLYVGGSWDVELFIQYVQDYTIDRRKSQVTFLPALWLRSEWEDFVSAYLMRFIAPNEVMAGYSVANIALVAVGVLKPGWVGLWCLLLPAFSSVDVPAIFALGLKGLGPNTKIGGSLLVMAIVGGAVITPLIGLISEKSGSIALAYSIALFTYVYIALYSWLGSKPRETIDCRLDSAS